ncbi:hypothetical protein GZ982_30000 (plasmid) [Pseudomonas fluorescens]|nr:hypothetical protein GZ982_30000 [Pseudomonas fluorescens]
MADPIIINPTLTLAGQAAAFNASNDGLELKITHVSFGTAHYDPTGEELELVAPVGNKVPVAGASRPTPYQIRMVSAWREDVGQVGIGEIAFWAGDTLAFVWSKADGTVASYKTNGVTYVLFNDLAFSAVPANSISFVIDPDESVALAALAAHEGAYNAHPQYVLRAKFPDYQGHLWGDVGGTANAITLTLPDIVELTQYIKGNRFSFKALSSNTGDTTINVEGVGPVQVLKTGGVPLTAGSIVAGGVYDVYYDGATFQLTAGAGFASAEATEAEVTGTTAVDSTSWVSVRRFIKGLLLKAPLASPALTGSPSAPTPALFDNTTKLSTTEFVKKSSGNHAAIGSLSANTALTAVNTFGMGYLLNSVNPFTVTLPLGSTGPNGGVVNFTNVSTGAVTIKLPATNYVAGMPGVGDGGSIILKQFDTITLSTAGGTAWYAEDGSVRDVQSTAMQDLMTGKISIGQFGLGGVGAPVLGDFKAINTGGLYLAYGALVPNLATPNAPPESDNKVLGVLAITPRSDCTYYYVFETGTSSSNRRFWVGQYTMPGGVLYWSNLLSSDQLATQAQVDAGVLDNVVVTPKTMRWGFAASFGSNGYLAFPSWLGNFVIQWANGQIPAGAGTAHINLAMAFNTSLLAYSISTSSSATFMSCQGASVNGIDVLARTVSAGAIAVPAGIVGYTFICVGK